MQEPISIQGRVLSTEDLKEIERLIRLNPTWHRTRLSKELCALWKWQTPTGQLKDMACRTMLLKLHRRGLIELPPRQGSSFNHRRGASFQPVLHDTQPIEGPLSSLRPLRLVLADRGPQKDLWLTLLKGYHYLGLSTRVGKNIAYLALDSLERPVGAFLFGAAAWKAADRDRYIGWTPDQRKEHLDLVVNNNRFLIPPWVRVPHLASHVLALAARRLSADWQSKYGHELVLLETFVEQNRFEGTCYKAANWIRVGQTTGRTRNDRAHTLKTPIKSIYLYPLHRSFRRALTSKHLE